MKTALTSIFALLALLPAPIVTERLEEAGAEAEIVCDD